MSNQRRPTKRDLVKKAVKIMYEQNIDTTQAFRLFNYYDDLTVSWTLREAFATCRCIDEFDKSVNNKVYWTYQRRDAAENFYDNVAYWLYGL